MLGGFCPRGVLSLRGFVPEGFCPRGFCPRGFCPRGVLSVYHVDDLPKQASSKSDQRPECG